MITTTVLYFVSYPLLMIYCSSKIILTRINYDGKQDRSVL